MIREVQLKDAPVIAEIYNYFIAHTVVTFEENPVTPEAMKQRIADHTDQLPWLVYEKDQTVLGFAYASEWKSRCAYKHSIESTIYLNPEATGKGIGYTLYRELIDQLKALNFHAVIGAISLPNDASIGLHKKLGFEQVGQFKEVGFKFNQWVDVSYWELIFDSSSKTSCKTAQ